MNTQKPVYKLLIQTTALLTKAGAEDWALNFADLAKAYREADDILKEKHIARQIVALYGGMGSFLDLVLYNHNNQFVADNEQLDALRHELHQEVIKVIQA